jgi:hypothetical protein
MKKLAFTVNSSSVPMDWWNFLVGLLSGSHFMKRDLYALHISLEIPTTL